MTIQLSKEGARQTKILGLVGSVTDATAAISKTKAALAELGVEKEAAERRGQDAIERALAGEGDEAAEAAGDAEIARLQSRERRLLGLLARQEQELAEAEAAARNQAQQDRTRALKALLNRSEDAYSDLNFAIDAFAHAFNNAFDADRALRDFLGGAARPEYRL